MQVYDGVDAFVHNEFGQVGLPRQEPPWCVHQLGSPYALRYLADRGPLRGIDADADEALDRFGELVDGAFSPGGSASSVN
jgi:hypothetical protein